MIFLNHDQKWIIFLVDMNRIPFPPGLEFSSDHRPASTVRRAARMFNHSHSSEDASAGLCLPERDLASEALAGCLLAGHAGKA